MANSRRDSRVLDFGCGWGARDPLLPPRRGAGNLVGVDIDERAVSAVHAAPRTGGADSCAPEVLPPSSFDESRVSTLSTRTPSSLTSPRRSTPAVVGRSSSACSRPEGVVLANHTLGGSFIERSSTLGGRPTKPTLRPTGSALPANPSPRHRGRNLPPDDRGEYCYGAIDDEQNPPLRLRLHPRKTYARRRVGCAVRSSSLVAESRTAASDDGRAHKRRGRRNRG